MLPQGTFEPWGPLTKLAFVIVYGAKENWPLVLGVVVVVLMLWRLSRAAPKAQKS